MLSGDFFEHVPVRMAEEVYVPMKQHIGDSALEVIMPQSRRDKQEVQSWMKFMEQQWVVSNVYEELDYSAIAI